MLQALTLPPFFLPKISPPEASDGAGGANVRYRGLRLARIR